MKNRPTKQKIRDEMAKDIATRIECAFKNGFGLVYHTRLEEEIAYEQMRRLKKRVKLVHRDPPEEGVTVWTEGGRNFRLVDGLGVIG